MINARTLFACLAIGLGFASPAAAVPVLQIGIGGTAGTDYSYDPSSETTVASSDVFNLILYYTPGNGDAALPSDQTFYVSAALTSPTGPVARNDNLTLGSINIGGSSIDVVSDMEYGTPPIDADLGDNTSLPSHGIFETYFVEIPVSGLSGWTSFNKEINVQDLATNPSYQPSNGLQFRRTISVNLSELADGYGIHFDMYTLKLNGRIDQKAPFSHDAAGPGGGVDHPEVPEPATIVLGGIGLAAGLVRGRRS